MKQNPGNTEQEWTMRNSSLGKALTWAVFTSAAVLGLTSATLAGETDLSREAAIAGADFWVAPGGKDTNPGTAAAPFATLERARQAVREKVAAGLTKDLLVLIRGGTYEQTATREFGPPDSGSEKYSITYAA